MNRFLSSAFGWFRLRGGALAEGSGEQSGSPTVALVSDTSNIGPDGALQISTVWLCIERRANIVASLPYFVYEQLANGQKQLARASRLYTLLHDSPNARMTPFEFWRAMMLNHDLRGNAYARLERLPPAPGQSLGEVFAVWPMPADQVQVEVLKDGSMVYLYRIDDDLAVLSEDNVLHLKNLGNGTMGLAKLQFMRATTDEAAKAQSSASRIFGTGGKPTGVLMVDNVMNEKQREAVKERFSEMQVGPIARLYVLEASMKYQQLSMSPADQQLLETRHFTIEELCRWFDVPPVLVRHSNVTTWGSGVEQIIDGFHKFTIAPMLVNIQQAVRKRVMTPAQRATMAAEFSLDALLRGNAKDRTEIAAKKVQNGLSTRNEMRQLENDPPLPGGDVLTVQVNLLPIELLGKVKPTLTPKGNEDAVTQDAVAQ